MKVFLKKLKQCFGRIHAACKAKTQKVKNVLGKWEDRLWSVEDRVPVLKPLCCKVWGGFQGVRSGICGLFHKTFSCARNVLLRVWLRFARKIRMPSKAVGFVNKVRTIVQEAGVFLLKRRALLWAFIAALDGIILLWGLLLAVPILLILVAILWVDIVIYALLKMENRAMLLLLSSTFFVFLMGRELLQYFFRYQLETFPREASQHTYLCLLLALAGLFAAYWLTKRKMGADRFVGEEKCDMVLKVSRFAFVCVLIPAVIYRLVAAVFVQVNGYFAFYTEFQTLINDNLLLYAFSKLDQMVSICICIYMASMPPKKEFYKTAVLYGVYLVLTLGSGARGPFLLGVLLLLFYLLYRAAASPAEGWFKRRHLVWCVGAFAVFALVFYFGGLVRDGAQGEGNGLLDGMVGFVYSQGVSVSVIKRGFMLQDEIPDGYLYSMNFVRSGFIARFFDIPVYSGNSVETALYGGNFAHALSYIHMPESYLAGRGTGTSYVAELFHDFWYIGIVLGSAVYGWLCAKTDTYRAGKLFSRTCLFIMITQVLWAPRGSYSGMLTVLLSPAAILVMGLIFTTAWLLERRKRWRAVHAGGCNDGE